MWSFPKKQKQRLTDDPPSEQDPLIPNDSRVVQNASALEANATTRTPLPVTQLIVLCAMRFTEPISYTVIFPFINQMLDDLKVAADPKNIGYYAGVIESIFAVAQLCTALFWGRLSDRIGRKPVMLTGLAGTAMSVVAFGLQKHFVGLLVARAMAGGMNGNVAILQSVVAEITDPTNYAEAAALLPLCFACGLIVGPMIGGYLAAPVTQYPTIFGKWKILAEYPYFLPCLIGGTFNLAAIFLGIFFLEETLPSKRKTSRPTSTRIVPTSGDAQEGPPPSIASLCTRPVIIVLLTYFSVHFQNTAWSAAIPLYCQTRLENGGLGLSLNETGFLLSTQGIGIIMTQMLLFPSLQRRFGVRKLMQYSIPFSLISVLFLPLVTYTAHSVDEASSTHLLVFLIIVALIRSPGVMCYVCAMIMIKELSPAPNCLGTLNGMLQTAAALSQTIGPAMGASLFAFSIWSGWLGGNLVWMCMAIAAVIPQILSFHIVQPVHSAPDDSMAYSQVSLAPGSTADDDQHVREIESLNDFLLAEGSLINLPSDHQSAPILIRKRSFAGSTAPSTSVSHSQSPRTRIHSPASRRLSFRSH